MSIVVREKPLKSNLSLGIVIAQEVMRLHPGEYIAVASLLVMVITRS